MNSLSVAQGTSVEELGYNSIDSNVDPAADRTASAAHHIVDTLADQALTGVGKVSGSLHVAVNQAADAVTNAANWVAQVPTHVLRKQTKVADAALAAMRARPLVTLGSALAVGYLIFRLGALRRRRGYS